MSVCCECCVLSGRGLCDKLITCPEEFYRLWRVIMYDLETSWMMRPCPTGGRGAVAPKTNKTLLRITICSNQFVPFKPHAFCFSSDISNWCS
jgi:hypothetical protein